MSIFSKARVKVASNSNSKLNFNCSHLTTGDFFQFTVPYNRHLVPGQSINVDFNCFSRLAPMPVPTLSNVRFKHHAFFVPFKSVMPSWDDFITDTPHVQYNSPLNVGSIVPFAHRVSLQQLTESFVRLSSLCEEVPVESVESAYDLDVWFGSTPEHHCYKLTSFGRSVYKLLRSLGYDFMVDCTAGSYNDPLYVSALPLLAVTRVYVDWFYPSAYVGDARYNNLIGILKHDESGGYTLSASDLSNIYTLVSGLCYDSDYFVSAFDNPAGPNNGLFSTFNVPDISSPNGIPVGISGSNELVSQSVNVSSNGTPYSSSIYGTSSSLGNTGSFLTKYLFDSLHALSDYMKRHQLVGSRALERYLARFGVKLEQSDRSLLLGSSTQSVQLGAIMSNADTEGAALGAYAGQGYSNDGASFSFKTEKDYGIFFVVTTILPETGYVQGFDRNLYHLSKLDFFTPEFDNLGTQAISSFELVSGGLQKGLSIDSGVVGSNNWTRLTFNKVFGFTPRYAEYKIQLDKMTGDFNIPRVSAAGMSSDSWHLYRLFNQGQMYPAPVHGKPFVLAGEGSDVLNISSPSQYDRMFGNTTAAADHFVLIYNFNISSNIPAKPLFDTYDFDEEKGRSIEIESGGTKVN